MIATAAPALTVGVANDRFEPVVDVFQRLVATQGGGTAALSVRYEGRAVLELTAGRRRIADRQLVFSISKAVLAIAAQLLVQEGILDLDAPIGELWPAYARPSTASVTTRQVLAHTAGLPGIGVPLSIDEVLVGSYRTELENEQPWWQPGTRVGYHAFTFGLLVAGVIECAAGQTAGYVIADRIATRLGLALTLGSAVGTDILLRRAEPPAQTDLQRSGAGTLGRGDAGSAALFADWLAFNRDDVLAAPWGSTNVLASASDLARLFGAVVDGELLSPGVVAELVRPHSVGVDAMLGIPIRFGAGVQLPFPQLPLLGPGSFGHEGAGGGVVAADPSCGLSVAFLTDTLPPFAGASPAALALLATVRYCASKP